MASKDEVLHGALEALVADVRRQSPNGYVRSGDDVYAETEDGGIDHDRVVSQYGACFDASFDLRAAFLAALRAADALGWRMVPKEASTEMFQAFVDGEWFEQKPRPREIWDAMLSASPSLIEG